jgi:hypothetical protein
MDISESPKGSHSVSKAKVRPGESVDFTVDFDPKTVAYYLLDYNVVSVELYRKREDELDFTFWKSMSLIASHRATYRWEPVAADAGKYEFAAFVNTQILVPRLEVAPNSIRPVEVSCFGASGRSAEGMGSGLEASTCADTWGGTAQTGDAAYGPDQTEATLTLKVDTRVDTGDPAIVAYYAEGTVKVTNPAVESGGCTLSPTEFTIDRDTGSNTPGHEGESNQFFVDYGKIPATFTGGGNIMVTQTVSCPKIPSTTTTTFGYPFFRSDRLDYEATPLSADGLTIQDSRLPFWSFELTRP